MEKNNLVKKIEEYKEISESLLQLIKSLSQYQPLPDWVPAELNNYVSSIKEAANETIKCASSAVKIGIMGEFSGGKTLLLGSLIGYADALPSSEIPTTGNVTAIHLVQQPNFQTTQFGNFIAKYLSHKDVTECLIFMLQKAEKLANEAGLSRAEVNSLISLYPMTKIDSNGILECCQEIFNKSNSLGLRSLIRELVIFIRTYQVYGEHICGKSYSIDKAIAKQGLVLPEQSGNILEQEFENLFPTPKSWESYAQPSVRDLQNSFSLIHRIDVTVEISKEIWDLSSLQGTNEFVLLDFPGLGADDSSVRDTFVSLRELKEVQTILLLLDGRRPGAATATKIRTMLEQYRGEDLKDRIIVGIGRFNQLSLDNNHREAITELINETLISEEIVLDKLPTLKRTIGSASNLTTEKSNVILLSQLYGLNALAETSRLVQVCSPDFSPELDRLSQQDDSKIRQKWRQLSEILPTSSLLQKQLSDFAEDGGIARLRLLLKEHIERHGIRLLLEDTQSKTKPITKPQQDLQTILTKIPDYIPVIESSDFLSLRKAIENLIATYNRFQQELETQPILKTSNGVAVTDIVKEELSDRIFFDWNQWKILFERVNNGTISIKTTGRIIKNNDNSIPTKSADFYHKFEETIQEMQDFAQGKLRQVVIELFSALSQRVELQNNNLRNMVQPERKDCIKQKFDSHQSDLFKILLYAVDPINQWQDELVKESGLLDNVTPIKADEIFPLAHKDDKHEKSQIFHWSPDKKYPIPPRPFHHQILVLRVRDEITASASLHLVEDVSKLNKQIKSLLSEYVKEILDYLRELLHLKYEPLLRYIASAEEPGTPTAPPWLELLSQIAKIRYPDIF